MRRALALTAAVWLLVGGAQAWAAQRYASASPTSSGPTCTAPGTSPGPCSIQYAVGAAAAGDEVIVEPGDYKESGAPMTSAVVATAANLTIHAAPGSRPRLFFGAVGGSDAVFVGGSGDSISGLDVEVTSTQEGLTLGAGTGADRMLVHNSAGTACRVEAPIMNSVCWATGGGGNGLGVSPNAASATLTLRNDTVESTVNFGLFVGASAMPATVTVNALNVIAHGSTYDVVAKPGTNQNITINLGYSNYVTHVIGGNGMGTGAINESPPGSNQTTSPAFVNGAAGDFHELASSTGTVDRGHDDGSLGPLDLDGNPRVLGPAPDIGAYEFVPPPPSPSGGGGAGGGALPLPVTAVRATISALFQTHPVFRVGLRSTPLLGRTTRIYPRGDTFSFRLNQPAVVAVRIQRKLPGRRVGRLCKAPTRALRFRPRCTRLVLKATLRRTARVGLNRIAFSGRIRGRALPAGFYRAAFTAANSAGTSALRALNFRIVAR